MSNSCKNRCAPSVNSSHTGEFIIRARRTEDDVNSEKYITAIKRNEYSVRKKKKKAVQAAETVLTLIWLWGAKDFYFLLSDSFLSFCDVDIEERASEVNLMTDGGKK